ncbi:MAG: anaerobic selenocysteine-containing dehydrogenase [Candidatus Poriferisodalaceae bacterium]|jgi:anaerobic selenocysteine-containing dehydrogenase
MSREIHGACPLNCPDGCAWTVTVDDAGVPVKLRGRTDHPFTRGSLCVKVNSYLDHVKSPDRLMHPMRRVGPKGSGQFERITWDEALAEISARLGQVIDEFGPAAIWPFTGTGTVGWLQGHGAGRRLWRRLGTGVHVINICSVAAHEGMGYTTGSAAGLDPEDVRHARLIILWGANILTSNQHLWPFISEAIDAGAHVVTIDPVSTRTAARSHEHLAPLPGTDGALAMGLMAEVVALGGHDEDWLLENAEGWGEFESALSDWSAERAEAICGVAADEIRGLARRVVDTSPMVVRLSMGMQRHAGGGQAARVISCLPALTGDYHRLGGGAVYSTSPFYGFDVSALYGFGDGPGPPRVLQMSQLAEVLDEPDERADGGLAPIKALFVHAANPAVSNPDQRRVRHHLAREDLFTVVLDAFPTDTTAYADIVLPSTLQTEHCDVNDSYSHLYVHWNEPVSPPPGECLAPTEVMRRLAIALGIDDPFVGASDDELAEAVLGGSDPSMEPVTLPELKKKGFVRLGYPIGHIPFLERFPTRSGRFTFTSNWAENRGHGRLPHYSPPAEAVNGSGSEPAEVGSLALVAPANHHFMNSQFANRPGHAAKAGPLVLNMHPADADARGLGDASSTMVTVRNERGSFEAELVVSETVRRGVVAATKGRAGVGVNQVTSALPADMAAGAVFHDAAVWVEPSI